MNGSMPLLSHAFSGGAEGQFYPFSYSPIATKFQKFQTKLVDLLKIAYRKKNLLVVSYGMGYAKNSLKSTNFL